MIMSPDEIKMNWVHSYPKVTYLKTLSLLKSKEMLDVHMQWNFNLPDYPYIKIYRVFRNDKLIGLVKGVREYYDKNIDKKSALNEQ